MPVSATPAARRDPSCAAGVAALSGVWPLVGLAALLLAAALAWCLWHGLALAAAVSAGCLGGLVGMALGHAATRQAWRTGQDQSTDAGDRRLQREQALFDMQAEQLEDLRRLAHTDPLTGLANRRHFLQALEAALADDRLPAGASLLLLRLHDLQGMNRRVGRAAADRALLAMAEAVQAYPVRNAHCLAGRLNGPDVALLLPVSGIGQETATALTQALRLPLLAIDARARVFAGAVDLAQPLDATRALALADAALAWAESCNHPWGGAGAGANPNNGLPPLDPAVAPGEQAWQRQISLALAQGRVALAAYPVQSADGRQLHLDCPLRVQLQPGGPMEPAARWLSLAIRSRLCAAVDEHALDLALAAIDADGLGRCVNMAAQSLLSVDFVAAVSRKLEDAPEAASRLWIDLPESLALERPQLVRAVARSWRVLGVRLGLEHAGDGLARITRLADLGLDCVRIDSRFVNHISGAGAADARRHLQGLVRLVQAVGLQVTAEGVRSADDLELLWALGFDAATGPALALQAQPSCAGATTPACAG